MVIGEPARLAIDLLWGKPPTAAEEDDCDFVIDLRNTLHSVHDYARNKMDVSIKSTKDLVDKGQYGEPYEVGDHVWLLRGTFDTGSRKFERKYEGIFRVEEKVANVGYRIKHIETGQTQTVHFNRLKRSFVGELDFSKVPGKLFSKTASSEPKQDNSNTADNSKIVTNGERVCENVCEQSRKWVNENTNGQIGDIIESDSGEEGLY